MNEGSGVKIIVAVRIFMHHFSTKVIHKAGYVAKEMDKLSNASASAGCTLVAHGRMLGP